MKREMLTKSDLLSFRRCPRKLWLEQHGPEQNIIATPDRRMQEGNQVRAKARERLGADILWPESAFAAAAKAEKELLAKFPGRTAVDVHMAHGGLYARADALIPKGKKYILQETKSSSFPLNKKDDTPDTPEERHLDDVAILACNERQQATALPCRTELRRWQMALSGWGRLCWSFPANRCHGGNQGPYIPGSGMA